MPRRGAFVEGTATLESPAAEADEAQPAASEESASPPESNDAEISAQMNALIRGQLGQVDSTSKPDTADADDENAEEPDGASASSEDVKPSDAPTPGQGRRASAAEIKRLSDENKRLTEALEAVQPKVPDASEEARTQAIETENRFRRLLMKPESDTDWTHEDIQFLEGEKQRRATHPELQQHYDTILEEDLKIQRGQVAAEVDRFWKHVRADMATAKDVPGVDFEAVKAATTFAERDRLMYAAGAAQHEPELKRLRDENAELKREMLGQVRAPMNGGRSSPGRTYSENDFMNTIIRGGRT